MKNQGLIRSIVILLILILNLGCDQMSKNMVRSKMAYHQQIKFFDNHVMLTRVENGGAFLSFGNTLSTNIKFWVLIVLPLSALLIGLYFLFVKSHLSRTYLLALSFIIGGGFGNIYDRYIYGAVTDFVHVDFVIFRTGIFNMADVSIMTGVFIVIASSLRKKSFGINLSVGKEGESF